jgi:hypothetical protein
MIFAGIDPPEPFLSSLKTGNVHTVCDLKAASALERFGRALARVAAAREDDARDDLENAAAKLDDVCRTELACLDIRQRRSIANAQVAAPHGRTLLRSP